MPIWDKTLTNLQKGHDKLTAFAQTFAERMRSEITIIRVRVQIDGLREKQGEQHRLIGRTLLDQRTEGTLPQTFELFFKSAEVTAALEKIAQYERDLENLRDELRSEARSVQDLQTRKDDEGA